MVMAFSSRARILGECLTIHLFPACVFFLFLMIYCCLSFLSSFFFTNTTHTNVHLHCRVDCKLIIIIYPLTARIVGAPQMTSQPVSSIFPCSPLPSGTWRTPAKKESITRHIEMCKSFAILRYQFMDPTHHEALSYGSGTKHTVAMGT